MGKLLSAWTAGLKVLTSVARPKKLVGFGDGDHQHRGAHDEERQRERDEPPAQLVVTLPVDAPQPHQPYDHENDQELERLVGV